MIWPLLATMKWLGVFLIPLDSISVQVTSNIEFACTHLYTWLEVCTMSPGRAKIQTAWSGEKGCFPLCHASCSESNGNTRNLNKIFRSNWANQDECLLTFFIPFPNSLRTWREVGQWTSLSQWNGKSQSKWCNWSKWTISRGGPKYAGLNETKLTFPLNFWLKYPVSLAYWKAPERTNYQLYLPEALRFMIVKFVLFIVFMPDWYWSSELSPCWTTQRWRKVSY